MASCSLRRVNGVRKSWLTPASMAVRWVIWRVMRSRMRLNSIAARRTSLAPSGLKSWIAWPLPNDSAAAARRRIGRTWLRMKTPAMANRISDVPTIHKMNT